MDYQTNQDKMKSEITQIIRDLLNLAETTRAAAEHARDAGWINTGRMLDAQKHIHRAWAAEWDRLLRDYEDKDNEQQSV